MEQQKSIHLQPTATAEWQQLIMAAETACTTKLGEALESYLVFLLLRFTRDADLSNSVLALDFLEALNISGTAEQRTKLQAVGDKCLLLAGLFPGRAAKRRVSLTYFINLGQTAYGTLANLPADPDTNVYQSLCEQFVRTMEVLQATRELHQDTHSLELLTAHELWQTTGSQRALHSLLARCQGGFPTFSPVTRH